MWQSSREPPLSLCVSVFFCFSVSFCLSFCLSFSLLLCDCLSHMYILKKYYADQEYVFIYFKTARSG